MVHPGAFLRTVYSTRTTNTLLQHYTQCMSRTHGLMRNMCSYSAG